MYFQLKQMGILCFCKGAEVIIASFHSRLIEKIIMPCLCTIIAINIHQENNVTLVSQDCRKFRLQNNAIIESSVSLESLILKMQLNSGDDNDEENSDIDSDKSCFLINGFCSSTSSLKQFVAYRYSSLTQSAFP